MNRNQITLTGVVLHDPRLSDSHPVALYTHIGLILPPDALPAYPKKKKRHVCVGECRIVFQNNIVHEAAQFAKDDIIVVSGYLVTGYVRDARINTNKVIANFATPVDRAGFSKADCRNQIEISGLLGDDPVEVFKPFHAWMVNLCLHLPPDPHQPHAKPRYRRYQVLFSEAIRDKALPFRKNDLVLVNGYFVPRCADHQTSTSRIIASSMTHIGKSHATSESGLISSVTG